MTTKTIASLKLLTKSPPYIFESLGIYIRHLDSGDDDDDMVDSEVFPKGSKYELTGGKFPMPEGSMLKNLYEYTLTSDDDNSYSRKVRIVAQSYCNIGDIMNGNEHIPCEIRVEIQPSVPIVPSGPKINKSFFGFKGGIKRRVLTKKSKRGKSKRGKSKRGKSKRKISSYSKYV